LARRRDEALQEGTTEGTEVAENNEV